MRFLRFSIAFSVTVQAIPFPSPYDSASELARRDEGPDFDISGGDRYYDGYPSLYDSVQDAASRLLSLEDDPAFAVIFLHVENILQSAAPAEDRLERILDAIVHHEESMQEFQAEQEEQHSSDEALFEIFKIMDSDEKSSDDKVEQILNEITEKTDYAQRFSIDDPAGMVLYRIRWILVNGESAQKRVQSMLEELAIHFSLEESQYGPDYENQQGRQDQQENGDDQAFFGRFGSDVDDAADVRQAEVFDNVEDEMDDGADIREDVEDGDGRRLRYLVEDIASTDSI